MHLLIAKLRFFNGLVIFLGLNVCQSMNFFTFVSLRFSLQVAGIMSVD